MDFQGMLLKVGNSLSRDDTKAIVFLCKDFLSLDPSSAKSATDIFQCLMKKELLSKEQPALLADLLSTIGRHRLLREFDLHKNLSITRSIICPFRKLLYRLSEEITGKDLKDIKFLLTEDLQCSALEPDVSTLEVFLAMERRDLLGPLDLHLLEKLLGQVCPVLLKDIQRFKACYETTYAKGTIAQETGVIQMRQRSSSDISSIAKSPTSLPDRPHSEVISGFDTNLNLPQSLSSLQLSNTPMVPFESHDVSSTETLTSTDKQTSGPQLRQATETEDWSVMSYPMTGQQRGFCWIVNNHDFSPSHGRHKNREGTQIDEESLRRVFEWLGFNVEVLPDATRDQMVASIRELASRNHSGLDCVACFILSHGQQDVVYGVDGKEVSLMELTNQLSELQCASLRGKPKLFFIQACQGHQRQQAFYIQEDGPSGPSGPSGPGDICIDAVSPSESVPYGSDLLIATATIPSFVSLRDTKQGTWFIQSLCRKIVQMVPCGHDLITILTRVNDDVSQMRDSTGRKRQMPRPSFSLRKRVVFPVPKDPPPHL